MITPVYLVLLRWTSHLLGCREERELPAPHAKDLVISRVTRICYLLSFVSPSIPGHTSNKSERHHVAIAEILASELEGLQDASLE